MKKRKFFWGTNPETGAPRYKARVLQPLISDDEGNLSQETWLELLLEGNQAEERNIAEILEEIKIALQSANLPEDLIQLVVMRGEGMTFTEISEKVGKNKDALRQQLKRVEGKIEKALQGQFTLLKHSKAENNTKT